MKNRTVRWGIIGLGRIAHKFAEGLKSVEGAVLKGVASSNHDRAKSFAEEYKSEAFGSYEELVKSDEVDVVYIASFNTQHYSHAMLCLQHNKNVLCEKPLTLSIQESKKLFDATIEKKLFFMEAIWTRFLPSIQYAEKLVEEKTWGELKHITASFGFKSDQQLSGRHFNPELGGGALYDIGLYPIFLCLLLLGDPAKFDFDVERCTTGCDVRSKGRLVYENATADISCSFLEESDNQAVLTFEKAKLVLKPMWHGPTELELHTDVIEDIPLEWKGNGYNYEAQYVTDCILRGEWMPKQLSSDISLGIISMISNVLEK